MHKTFEAGCVSPLVGEKSVVFTVGKSRAAYLVFIAPFFAVRIDGGYVFQRIENAFFIGDGETDVLTSINAGIKNVSVLWGYRDKEQLSEVGATTFVQRPKDILNIIL